MQAKPRENPFLHMGLHLAVREQLSVDRPPGIRDLKGQLQARYGDAHRAEHALMEALGEELWTAQRDGRAPDEAAIPGFGARIELGKLTKLHPRFIGAAAAHRYSHLFTSQSAV